MRISKEDLQKILKEKLCCGVEQGEKSEEDLDAIAKKEELLSEIQKRLHSSSRHS